MIAEKIYFSRDKVPTMLALLRRGLEGETDKDLARNLRMQIASLEKYYETKAGETSPAATETKQTKKGK